LTIIFLGVIPTKAGVEGSLNDNLEFSWKKAIVFN
jgi:hypothetical protein